jgi:hypothetical protein
MTSAFGLKWYHDHIVISGWPHCPISALRNLWPLSAASAIICSRNYQNESSGASKPRWRSCIQLSMSAENVAYVKAESYVYDYSLMLISDTIDEAMIVKYLTTYSVLISAISGK